MNLTWTIENGKMGQGRVKHEGIKKPEGLIIHQA